MKYDKLIVTALIDVEILHFNIKIAFLYDLKKTLNRAFNWFRIR